MVDAWTGGGGVRLLSAEWTGDKVPFVGGRMGDDCVGDGGATWDNRAPSGESGVLQRSFVERATNKKQKN